MKPKRKQVPAEMILILIGRFQLIFPYFWISIPAMKTRKRMPMSPRNISSLYVSSQAFDPIFG